MRDTAKWEKKDKMAADENRMQHFNDIFDIFSMLVGENYVTLYDIKGQVTRYSTAIVDMLGLPGAVIPDGAYDWLDYVHPDDRVIYQTTMDEMIALRQLTYDLTYRVRLKDGTYDMFRLIGGIMRDIDGNPGIAGGMMIHEGMIENTDRVTVLKNQGALFSDIENLASGKGKYIALLIGFARLGHINEIYGYGYGNRVLRKVGGIIEEILDGRGNLYRIEGSKFVILSSELGSDAMAEVYNEVSESLRRGFVLDGIRHNLVACGGVMDLSPEMELKGRSIYICLLHAYHESKNHKQGKLISYNASNVDELAKSGSIEMINAIRDSITHDFEGFYLQYQPIFNLDRETIGAEVLLRWKDGRYGEVLPLNFLPEIENDFDFNKLGYWIMRNAMLDGKHFLENDADFKVYVNVSPAQLNDAYFADNIARLSEELEFPLKNLCVEFTRECRLADMDVLRSFSARLHEIGVRVGIDDFARGNAYLVAMESVEAEYVRFDRELVTGLTSHKNYPKILRHLSELVVDCDAQVFIKGIEGAEELELIKALPATGIQGNFLSEPVYFDEVFED